MTAASSLPTTTAHSTSGGGATTTACQKSRKWGGILFVLTSVGGLFLANSLLMYHRLMGHVDDEMTAQHQPFDDWAVRRKLSLLVQDDAIASKDLSSSTKSNIRSNGKTPSASQQQDPVRQVYERDNPQSDTHRDFVSSLHHHDFESREQRSDLPYNVYDCPEEPPLGYPFAWNVLDVLNHWRVDTTDVPEGPIYQGICVFDWNHDQMKAHRYREKELPFVLKNHPAVTATAGRWMKDDYLENMLNDTLHRNEHSTNNHFMFWLAWSPPPNWTPPTGIVQLSYGQWLEKAKALEGAPDQAQEEHFYFNLNANERFNHFLYAEMPFFDPEKHDEHIASEDPSAFLQVDPSAHRGIQCRFGGSGAIAELHYDSTRNFIALLGGQRRYILAHPDQCQNMELYERSHPSGRHSRVNWSQPADVANSELAKAMINEVILQAGDVLYLPTYHFHFIVSLSTTYQCNARSGKTNENYNFMDECGMIRK